MNETKQRLSNCFQLVFPALPESEIETATQANVREWDSVAAITLVNVIEEEFGIQLDLDQIADLNSFEAILEHLQKAHSLS